MMILHLRMQYMKNAYIILEMESKLINRLLKFWHLNWNINCIPETKSDSFSTAMRFDGYFKHQKTIQQMLKPPKIGGTNMTHEEMV